MAKSIINKKEYKVQNIGGYVLMWLHRQHKYIRELASELGISQQGLSYKISNNTFSYADLLTIFDYLAVPEEEILMVMKIK